MFRIPVYLLVVALLAACQEARDTVEVRFVPTWGTEPIDCSSGPDGTELTDLRFYISDVALESASGTSTPVVLLENGRWQGAGIALIDLENGDGHCVNGTGDENELVVARIPPGNYAALSFTVGVPFSLNHADPLLAESPLDDTTMHWHWRSGYKFLRAGYRDEIGSVSVHLGSAGCAGSVQDIDGCRYPNRFTVRLREWEAGREIAVDLQGLARVSAAGRTDSMHCESAPRSELCHTLMPAFGIDPRTGTPGSPQEVFSLRPL